MTLDSNVYQTLKRELASRQPGDKLETVRELMVRFSATQFAVQSSLTKLKTEGVIETKVGKGSFVAGKNQQEEAVQLTIDQRIPKVLLVTHVMKSGRGKHVAAAIYDKLVEVGCSVISISYNDVQSLNTVLNGNQFDLCLLQPRRSVLTVDILAKLKKAAKHVIVEGRNLEQADVDILLRDRFGSVNLAFKHLTELGHKNIGLISEENSDAVGYEEIEQIFKTYCAGAGNHDAMIVKSTGQNRSTTNQSIELIDAIKEAKSEVKNFPTAFIVSGHFTGEDLSNAFQAIDLKIPEEVSILRLRIVDDLNIDGGFFTSVARSSEDIASSIKDIFEWRLNHPNDEPVTHLDQPKLQVRKSTIPI